MKKLTAVILCLALVFSLTACKNDNQEEIDKLREELENIRENNNVNNNDNNGGNNNDNNGGNNNDNNGGNNNDNNGGNNNDNNGGNNNDNNNNNSNAPITTPPQVGQIIKFGKYDWRVLDVQDGKALIITEKMTESEIEIHPPYHENALMTSITWEICSMRQYLNNAFYNGVFSAEEKTQIIETTVINNDENPQAQSSNMSGNDTVDKIFLLSIGEAIQYFPDNSSRIAYNKRGVVETWYLRSPGYISSNAVVVNSDGTINYYGYAAFQTHGVRPALWFDYSGGYTVFN